MLDKVSLIVPVHNTENYLEKCIQSLLVQDYTDLEIIIVDDGSTDNSPQIIKQLSLKDKRIIPIYKKAGGVSSARNRGLKIASGDYVMFVDADDYVEPDYVSYFLRIIHDSGTDIAANLALYTWRDKSPLEEDTFTVSSSTACKWIYTGKINVAVWNKIYKRSVFSDVIFNDEIWYGEGMLYNIECLQKVTRIEIGNKRVYHQRFNSESAMRNFNLQSNFCGIASLWLQRAKIEKMTPDVREQWEYHLYCYNKSIIDGLVRSGQASKYRKELKESISNLRKNIILPMKYSNNIRQKMIWVFYFIFPVYAARVVARRFQTMLKQDQSKDNISK